MAKYGDRFWIIYRDCRCTYKDKALYGVVEVSKECVRSEAKCQMLSG